MNTKLTTPAAFALLTLLFVSCAPTVVPVISVNPSTAVTKLDFSNQSKAIYAAEGLSNQSIFLVKVNASGSDIPYAQTGNVYSYSLGGRTVSVAPAEFDTLAGSPVADSDLASFALTDGPHRVDSLPAQRYNANPPSASEVSRLNGMARSSVTSAAVAAAPPAEGDTKSFYVQLTSVPYTTSTITATLRKSGDHCHVWVVADSFSNSSGNDDDAKLTQTEIDVLAAKFDAIYPAETGLIGYEYGGDPNLTASYGGKDGDPKISILVYDINGDAASNASFIVYGYFTSVDYLDANAKTTVNGIEYTSNGMEMFYIDSLVADKMPQQIYSTLIHEFQHMINYNQKNIVLNSGSPTWYNEMLSLMTEEVIGTKVGIDATGLPWASRMPYHLVGYSQTGLEYWASGDYAGISYAQAYAFGSYLMHNFGGPRLLHELEGNAYVGKDSVSQAVAAVKGSAMSFADVYRGYPQALLFTRGYKDLGYSYDTEVSWSNNGIDYACPAYDLGAIGKSSYFDDAAFQSALYWPTQNDYPESGISYRKLNYFWDLPSYGVSIHSSEQLQDVTGSASITVTAPTNPNVEMYIVVR